MKKIVLVLLILALGLLGCGKQTVQSGNDLSVGAMGTHSFYGIYPGNARIYEGKIVAVNWTPSRGEYLMLYDIATGTSQVIDHGSGFYSCDIYGNNIVYVKNINQLHLYNINSGKITLLDSNVRKKGPDVKLNDSYVLYTRENDQVVVKSLNARAGFPETIVTTMGGYIMAISNFDSGIAWTDSAKSAAIMYSQLPYSQYVSLSQYNCANGEYSTIENDKKYFVFTCRSSYFPENKISVYDADLQTTVLTIQEQSKEVISADIYDATLPSAGTIDPVSDRRVVYRVADLILGVDYIKLYMDGQKTKTIYSGSGINLVAAPKIYGDYIIWHKKIGNAQQGFRWELHLSDIKKSFNKVILP